MRRDVEPECGGRSSSGLKEGINYKHFEEAYFWRFCTFLRSIFGLVWAAADGFKLYSGFGCE